MNFVVIFSSFSLKGKVLINSKLPTPDKGGFVHVCMWLLTFIIYFLIHDKNP